MAEAQRTTPLRVLIVEDVEEDAILVARELRRGFGAVEHRRVDHEAEMRRALSEERWDAIIADFTLPRFDVFAAIRIVREYDSEMPVIAVSGRVGEDAAVETLKSGAGDFVTKDNLVRLVPALVREIREADTRRERKRIQKALDLEAAVSADLARVSRAFIEFLNHPDLLDRLCVATSDVLDCDRAAIILSLPGDVGFQRVAEFTKCDDRGSGSRPLKVLSADLAAVLAQLRDEDVAETAELAEGGTPSVGDLEEQSPRHLHMALRSSGTLIGLLTASYVEPSVGEAPRRRRVADGIAKLASMALTNARLFDELERANRLKSEFVATMSHELRTPLNVILGYDDLLLGGEFGRLSPEQEDTVRRLHGSALQLHELVEQILQIGRVDSGDLPVNLKECDPNDLLTELRAEMGEAAAKPSIAVRWQLGRGLPRFVTDKSKLKVVLRNLISNAIKFTERGRVDIGVRDCGDCIDFEVRDTGSGISPEVLPVIFEPFLQGDGSATRLHGGIGLGLYTVDRLLDLMGGSVDVESDVATGSVFRIHLPLGGTETVSTGNGFDKRSPREPQRAS